ncbi:cytochrome b5-like [Bicyclus anynana]|uniref:Cytochrome b5 n=1 Tax=Bicyclus anynana TaxID=110368 RepID=A0ABM3LET8_BICAN|nr:cytochrome b5-like [Bicyclus anynana]
MTQARAPPLARAAHSATGRPRDMTRRFTRQQLRAGSALVAIDNEVFDVSGFLHEHPGGADVLLAAAGGDASECFRRVGHSEDALQRRARLRLGEMAEAERWPPPPPPAAAAPDEPDAPAAALLSACGPPLLLAALAVLVYGYLLP